MLVATLEEGTDGEIILRINGRLCAGTAMYLGTVLEESINSGINHLTLDFSGVSDFDFTGVALSAAVLNSYGRDLSEMTCCGLPQNITDLLKAFMVDNKSCSKLVPVDCDPRISAIGGL